MSPGLIITLLSLPITAYMLWRSLVILRVILEHDDRSLKGYVRLFFGVSGLTLWFSAGTSLFSLAIIGILKQVIRALQ